jgi:hypothetical protein
MMVAPTITSTSKMSAPKKIALNNGRMLVDTRVRRLTDRASAAARRIVIHEHNSSMISRRRQLQAHVRRRPSELHTQLCYNSHALWLGQLWNPGQRDGAFPASTGLRSNGPLLSTKNTQSEA